MRFRHFTFSSRWLRSLSLALVTALLSILLGANGWHPAAFVGITPPAIAQSSNLSNSPATPGDAQQLLQQGRDRYAQQQFAQAITLWTQAENAFASQGSTLAQASTLSNLALAYRQLGELSKAEAATDKSLDLVGNLETLSAQGYRIYGQALNTQGSLQFAQGNARTALASWEKATDRYRQANHLEGVVKSLINQTYALRSLGFFRKSTDRLTEVETLLGNNAEAPLAITLYRSLGNTYRLIGELEESEISLLAGLDLAQKLQLPTEAAAIRLSLGNTEQVQAQRLETFADRTGKEGDRNLALEQYRTAFETYAAILDSAPLAIQVRAKLNQLDILFDQPTLGDAQSLSDAQSIYNPLFTQIESLPLGRSSTLVRLRLAHLLLDACEKGCPVLLENPNQQVYSLLSDAKEQAEALGDPIAESYALGYLGELYTIEGREAEAEQLTAAALQLTAQPSIAYQWQWQLGQIENIRDNRPVALEYYAAAVSNARLVRNDLLHIDADIRFDFRDRIEPLYREYISLLLPTDDTAAAKADTAVSDSSIRLAQSVIDDLRVAELESFLACGLLESSNSVELGSIQAVADSDQETAIIYPIVLDDRLEVLLRLPNQSESSADSPQSERLRTLNRYPSRRISTNVSVNSTDEQSKQLENTLEKKLVDFRRELEQPYFSSLRGRPLAIELYDWLVRPAEENGWLDPDKIKTLVFVLDGPFRNVPMAALYDQLEEEFLIEKYAIATTFGDLKIPKATPPQTFRVLAAGLSDDPSPACEDLALEENSNCDIFGPLIYVNQELESISEQVKNVTDFRNQLFTRDQIQTSMLSSDHNIVHLATHGEFGFTRDKTFLLAAADSTPPAAQIQDAESPSEEPLIAVEKIDLNSFDTLLRSRNQQPLELLLLSACETAEGDDREVLGMAGLAVQTGARSTLSTLWSISDLATSRLIETFYQELESGAGKASALQQAQKKLLSQGYNPSRWAPYLLVGDWR